jgi:hypothetical protein
MKGKPVSSSSSVSGDSYANGSIVNRKELNWTVDADNQCKGI